MNNNKTACTDDQHLANVNKKLKTDLDNVDASQIDSIELGECENELEIIGAVNKFGIIERVNKNFKRFSGVIKQT